MVGMENVRSQTRQGQVRVPEKVEAPGEGGSPAGGPEAQVDAEIEQPEAPHKPDVKVKTQLVHIGVKEFSSRGRGRHFGYIITGSE